MRTTSPSLNIALPYIALPYVDLVRVDLAGVGIGARVVKDFCREGDAPADRPVGEVANYRAGHRAGRRGVLYLVCYSAVPVTPLAPTFS